MKPTASELRDAGIESAINHADHIHEDWSVRAMAALKNFVARRPGEFMCCDVGEYATNHIGLPEPPNKRAWGGIIRKAASEGLIKKTGYGKTSHPSAHCANAAVWVAA